MSVVGGAPDRRPCRVGVRRGWSIGTLRREVARESVLVAQGRRDAATGSSLRSHRVVMLGPVCEVLASVAAAIAAADAWRVRDVANGAAAGVLTTGVAALLVVWLPWAWTGWLLRLLVAGCGLVGLTAVARLRSWEEVRAAAGHRELVLGAAYLALAGGVIQSHRRAVAGTAPVSIASPVSSGRFMVVQGGGRWTNHHTVNESQRFALDLVRARAFGPRTRRLRPRSLEDFLSFGAGVVSPVDGTVVTADDGQPDATTAPRSEGNCVVIELGDGSGRRVVLAHLRRDSVIVGPGTRVRRGDRVGDVGCSGHSSEPHLHIHAEDLDGRGVPLLVDRARPLRRNDLVKAARTR